MHFKKLMKAAGSAARSNAVPGLILQVTAATVLALYFLVPAAQPGFSWFVEQRARWGFGYSAVATAISGGMIPYLFLVILGRIKRFSLAEIGFYFVFWAIMGMQVDLLYRAQSLMFGNELTVSVLAKKVAFDQFVFGAFWAQPLIVLVYLWKNAGYSLSGLRSSMSREVFTFQIPTLVFSAWIVWIPAVAIIYALPPGLQIPMFTIVQCFWSLLVEILSMKKARQKA